MTVVIVYKSSGEQSFRKSKVYEIKNACMLAPFINLNQLLYSENTLESGIDVGKGIIIGLVNLEKE